MSSSEGDGDEDDYLSARESVDLVSDFEVDEEGSPQGDIIHRISDRIMYNTVLCIIHCIIQLYFWIYLWKKYYNISIIAVV